MIAVPALDGFVEQRLHQLYACGVNVGLRSELERLVAVLYRVGHGERALRVAHRENPFHAVVPEREAVAGAAAYCLQNGLGRASLAGRNREPISQRIEEGRPSPADSGRAEPPPRHRGSAAVASCTRQRSHPRIRARTLNTDSRHTLLDVNETRFHVRLHRYQPRGCPVSLAQDSSAAPARPRPQKRPTRSGSPTGPPQSTPRFRARRPAQR